jgi:cleavage and polyadenylation specificity factor subunit 1
VPPPIGGILLFAVNSIIYINQSVPSYGVSLNSIAKTTSKYPFRNMESTTITLDCAFASFLAADRLLVSLKNGDIYIVTLLIDSDSLRTVRGFSIKKGPGSVIPSCLINCCDNYLFIGSRVGNSVLLKYTVKNSSATDAADIVPIPVKAEEIEGLFV